MKKITMNVDVDLKNVQVLGITRGVGIEKKLMVSYHGESYCEVIEHKPDYVGMAQNKQLGKTISGQICQLKKYDAVRKLFYINVLGGGEYWNCSFFPCTEPVELDAITLQPIIKK